MKCVDILIVDDRLDGLITLEAVLARPGLNLVRAQSGHEALSLLDKYEFALILLDVQMPGLDGFQTANLIRQNSRYLLTPIIFVTAINKDDRYLYQGYEAGAVDYLFKPFDPQILKAKVSVFVELFNKEKQLEAQAEIIRESERRERYLRLSELEVESLKRYRALADAIPHMIWKARGDGSLDYVNRGWVDYTGISRESSEGNGWQRAIHEQDLSDLLKEWMLSMNDGIGFEKECRILNVKKEARWFWIKVVCDANQSGQVISWVATCTDIHDRKMAEMKLIEAEKTATSANLAKTRFLANMSHEIRTPMNSILGFTELMMDPQQSAEERVSCIQTVQRNGRQLLKIIDEILDISKVETGKMVIEKVDVNISNLLSDVKNLLQLQAKDKGLEFKIKLDSPVPRLVKTDPTRLRQILVNLIGNGIKFTQKGWIRVNVEWQPGQENCPPLLKFKISDSGAGIQREHREKLFQAFSQADSSTTRKYGGTGLGLALSKELAQALGGNVFLDESEPEKGSTFLVTIEAHPPEDAGFVSQIEFEVNKKSKRQVKEESKLRDLTVLLVEDVVDNQALMTHFLHMAGAKVDVANNGAEGIEKALTGKYNVVLMDIQMPVLDGYEATKRLREKGFTTPIVALTAHALKEERERILQSGCDDHLSKPVEFNTLIDHLDHLVHRNDRPGDISVQ